MRGTYKYAVDHSSLQHATFPQTGSRFMVEIWTSGTSPRVKVRSSQYYVISEVRSTKKEKNFIFLPKNFIPEVETTASIYFLTVFSLLIPHLLHLEPLAVVKKRTLQSNYLQRWKPAKMLKSDCRRQFYF